MNNFASRPVRTYLPMRSFAFPIMAQPILGTFAGPALLLPVGNFAPGMMTVTGPEA